MFTHTVRDVESVRPPVSRSVGRSVRCVRRSSSRLTCPRFCFCVLSLFFFFLFCFGIARRFWRLCLSHFRLTLFTHYLLARRTNDRAFPVWCCRANRHRHPSLRPLGCVQGRSFERNVVHCGRMNATGDDVVALCC